MAATRNRAAADVARAAMAAILARDKGSIPAPNEHEPRRVTAHLGEFRIEAEFPPRRSDTFLMIDRNGAPRLRAHVEPVWRNETRSDRIDIVDLQGSDWFADFLKHVPMPPKPKARAEKAKKKPRRGAASKTAKSRRAKAARRSGEKGGTGARRRGRRT